MFDSDRLPDQHHKTAWAANFTPHRRLGERLQDVFAGFVLGSVAGIYAAKKARSVAHHALNPLHFTFDEIPKYPLPHDPLAQPSKPYRVRIASETIQPAVSETEGQASMAEQPTLGTTEPPISEI